MPHKGLFKKVKKTVKKAGRTIGRAQRKSDRFVAKSVRKTTRSVGKGVSKAAKRVAKTRVTTNVSKGPFTSVSKFARKLFRGGRKTASRTPFRKLRKAISARTTRRRPRR